MGPPPDTDRPPPLRPRPTPSPARGAAEGASRRAPGPDRPQTRRFGRAPGALLLAASLVAALPLSAEDDAPFEPILHRLPGAIHQIHALDVAGCGRPADDLLVLRTTGVAPEAEKWLTWMPCGSGLLPGDPRIVHRRLDPEAALVDVARWPGRAGPQLIQASRHGLTVESLEGAPARRALPIAGGLPLPWRPWEVSRIAIVDDWQDLGPPSALVPALDGAWLVDLESGAARRLPMPVHATYRSYMPHLPDTEWRWLQTRTRWPTLARGDDDGDGRLDLFALSRWAIWIYHAGPEGLPDAPSRRIDLRPFDADDERDHESTTTFALARDLDGDARADLLLSSLGGGLSDGRTRTQIHLNPGPGADPSRPPAASRVLEGGFANIQLVDVDGDGRDELLETSLEFGVLQIVRFLLTRRMETTVRILEVAPDVPGGLRTRFEDGFSFRVDFGAGRIAGLVPSLGDWNGDGAEDFFRPSGRDTIAFRLGTRDREKPAFGSETGRQAVPLESGWTRSADLDGDGLDEIVAFSPEEPDAPLVVLHNRGRLPGTAPRVRRAPDP